jgi:predicted dienelactone hydrolase
MKWAIRSAVALVVAVAVLFGSVAILKTKVRPAPDDVPGLYQTEITVPHRKVALPVAVWYPTDAGATPELVAQNALFYGHYVQKDAPPLPGHHPVVVMSHGSGGNALQLGWLAADLARRGMIVIATDHPGTRSRDSDPHQTVKIWERPDDLTALLDWISATAPQGLVPDMSRVAALGFSLGGHSALALAGEPVSKTLFIDYCDRNAGKVDCGWMQAAGVDFTAIDATLYDASHKDPRVAAVVAVDPALPQAVTPSGTQDITAKAMILNLGEIETVPEAMRADALADRIIAAEYAAIPGAWHFSFLPECSAMGRIVIGLAGDDNICSDSGMRDRGVLHQELRVKIGDFLDQALAPR